MIPLHKLAKLPKTLKLRKAASIIAASERKLVLVGEITTNETEYLCALLKFLINENVFEGAAAGALHNALSVLNTDSTQKEKRRVLNNVYHIIKTQTGAYPSDWDFFNEEGALDPAKRQPFPGMQVYLEDIRAPFNVGSMFRAAESFGAEKIWLSPLCADPKHKRAQRTAMGCVDVLPWEKFYFDPFEIPTKPQGDFSTSPEGAVSRTVSVDMVKTEAHPASSFFLGPFFALETGGTPLEDFSFPKRGVLIAGSEELGVSPAALAAADASLGRVSITSYGAKGSLNVSVAFGIVMQSWAKKLALISVCP